MALDIRQIYDRTWVFDEGGVRFFLLEGDSRALLIDSGMATGNADELAASLTDRPVELLNTHADRDHTGSNARFKWAFMHPSETVNYYKKGMEAADTVPVWEGDVIDLGNRPLEIIHLPGHTPGSIAVLDRDHRALFSGDPIQEDGNIFMFGPYREMHAYMRSMKRLDSVKDRFDRIYPSHGRYPLSTDVIGKLITGAGRVLAGEVTPSGAEMHGNRIAVYDVGVARFLCDLAED